MCYVSAARIATAAGVALLAACAGNGAGLDANGQPLAGGAPPPPLTADFQSIQDNVFTPICVHCHSGAGAPEGLELDAAHSYALLVGVPSNEQSARLRVMAGAPDMSYLVLKLEGSASISGAQMPFGGPPLPQATIDVIRQWISDGAANSAAASVAATAAPRFAVTATAPADGALLASPVSQIVVAFSHEADASSINDTTVLLERLDVAGDTGAAISLRLAAGNPAVLLVTPRAALATGHYRLTLRGAGGGALADLAARSLEDDYRSEFTVEIQR